MKNNTDYALFNGIGSTISGSGASTLPIQNLKKSQKNNGWKKSTVDALEREGLKQIQKNLVFTDWRAMAQGRFTYLGTGISDFQELSWYAEEAKKLRKDMNVDTYIKHFDFIGIIVNALSALYTELDDRYRVESIDEYSTNEFIRQKTEMMHQSAQIVFKQEIDRMLLMRGIDPNRSEFKSEEEQQMYQEEVQQQVKALTPSEIEEFMSKNFKVLATEWAQNVLTADKKRFYLQEQDREDFVSYLLTGRFFRHYRVGYDSYSIEEWLPEQTFFSQDAHAKYPQDGEYAGRIHDMPVSEILNKFGHIMNLKQSEAVGNYWNQDKNSYSKNFSGTEVSGGKTIKPSKMAFPEPVVVPFHNYFDHKINTQLEDALGKPLGTTTVMNEDGDEESFSSWMPREENELNTLDTNFSQHLRDDIEVRRDTVRVTEGYWRSQKRMGVLIYKNDFGSLSVELTDDDLLEDFLKENEIKKPRNTSLQELQKALKNDNLEEHEDTITYFYAPEVWKFVKIKGNGSTIKEDMYLDVAPLDYQIKGENSDLFGVKLPVTGIIDTGITPKLEPYQQLHNICMNQVTELLEKELGVFFTFDITGLSEEYQDESTEEALYRMRDNIKDTSLLGLDLSRQNTQGNQPKLFERQEVVFATQVQYRMELARTYKQMALEQIGITPQLLGQPNTYTTAEGVKQSAQASYALINHMMDKMQTAKAKGMEVHLAIAQYCEKEGKDSTTITRKGDGELRFLDILREDEELFPLRNLSVHPVTNSNERKKIEQIKQYIANDNTIERSYSDVIQLFTNPVLVEVQEQAKVIEKKQRQKVQEEREFQSSQSDKLIQANKDSATLLYDRQREMQERELETKIDVSAISAAGRASDKESNTEGFAQIAKFTQQALDNDIKEEELSIKQADQQRKITADKTSTAMKMQELALRSEEIKAKNHQTDAQKFQAIINKN